MVNEDPPGRTFVWNSELGAWRSALFLASADSSIDHPQENRTDGHDVDVVSVMAEELLAVALLGRRVAPLLVTVGRGG